MTLLRRHRLANGLTQKSLAAKLKITPSCVSFWESGTWKPHASLIPKLAKLLNVDAMELTKIIEPLPATMPGSDAR